MTIYAVAQGRITDPASFERYVELARPTLTAHDVKVLAFDEAPTAVEGEVDYPRTIILEFPDSAAFYRWYDSPEYQAACKHRLPASVGRFILVEAV